MPGMRCEYVSIISRIENAESLLHDLRMYAGGGEQRAVLVPHVVESDVLR
jgi:hypothetical protein